MIKYNCHTLYIQCIQCICGNLRFTVKVTFSLGFRERDLVGGAGWVCVGRFKSTSQSSLCEK